MREKGFKTTIRGLPVTVLSIEAIIASGCEILAVPYKHTGGDLSIFEEGTSNGFACSLCEQDCVLAPSGQAIFASGKNSIVCMECAAARLRQGAPA